MKTWRFLSRSDRKLVLAALAGEEVAREELVLRYQRKGYATVQALGVSEQWLDDVVQQAFLRAFGSLHALRDPSKFGPWFLAIARNVARRQVATRLETVSPEFLDQREAKPSEALEIRELKEALWQNAARLPEDIRQVVFLYTWTGSP